MYKKAKDINVGLVTKGVKKDKGKERSVLRLVVPSIMFAMVLAACSTTTTSNTSAKGNKEGRKTPVTIGLIAAETGSQALDGKITIDAVDMEVEAINAKGGAAGHPLKVITLDNETTNSGTVADFERLSENSAVKAIIGTPISTDTQAVIPLDKTAKIVYIYGGSEPELGQEGDPWLIRTRPTDDVTSKVAADLSKQLGLKTVAIIHSTDSFGASAAALGQAALSKAGIKVVSSIGYVDGTPDFTPTALAAKQAGAQGLLLYTTEGEDSGRLIKALAQAGVTTKNTTIIGLASAPTTPSLQIGGSAWNGAYMVSDMFCGANNLSKSFCEKFEAKYHLTPDLNASYAYDGVQLIAKAIENTGKTSRSAIRSGILSVTGPAGLEPGNYDFNKYGNGIHAEHILRVEDGHLTFFEDES